MKVVTERAWGLNILALWGNGIVQTLAKDAKGVAYVKRKYHF